jgi:hypothetical protein
VPRRGLDRQALGFEPADELADVLPHLAHRTSRRVRLLSLMSR